MSKVYGIVWNKGETEGFISDDPADIEYASTGFEGDSGVSSLAYEFRELYEEQLDDGENFRVTSITINE